MPPQGQNVNQHIAEKYGSDPATIKQNRQQLRRIGNQQRLQMALMQAYFGENQDISSGLVLLDIAIECGFTREQAESALKDQELAQQVRARETHYKSLDIAAVPTFIFNQQYKISGAQDADVMCNVISKILENSGSK